MNTNCYLEQIDRVVAEGPYQDNWVSLCKHPVPKWYQNAKFGIFIHWGVYSVPAFSSEWYPRQMYLEGTKEFAHHVETYGAHKDFGYKDFIPMFKGENFDATQWLDLFEEAGAKYIMPVAEHHDGFQLYDSELSNFNAAKMGPCRDIIGELKEQADKRGIVFAASSHRMEHYWFMDGGLAFDSDVCDEANSMFYGGAYGNVVKGPTNTHDIYDTPPSKAFLDDWLVRTCELVDKYQPQVMWFDWWIHNIAAKPYLKKFAAYYYNRSLEWGKEVTINYKYDAYMRLSGVYDIERGQLAGVSPRFWQNDTAIAKNSWGYTHNNDFKNPVDIICDIIDVVSKNGCLLLNVGPRPDGTITSEDTQVLKEIGQWMKRNGEAIYNTSYWTIFGEGPTMVEEGSFTDVNRAAFTSHDIRFTFKDATLYAIVLKAPTDGVVSIKALKKPTGFKDIFGGHIKDISLLGYTTGLQCNRTDEALVMTLNESIETEYPIVFKMELE